MRRPDVALIFVLAVIVHVGSCSGSSSSPPAGATADTASVTNLADILQKELSLGTQQVRAQAVLQASRPRLRAKDVPVSYFTQLFLPFHDTTDEYCTNSVRCLLQMPTYHFSIQAAVRECQQTVQVR